MTAGQHFNEHDIEQLSAYIDGMLTDSEHAVLEQRLQNDADLRRELATLRETVSLINQLPSMQAPRNFTIHARMMKAHESAPKRVLIFPTAAAFSAISAAAAVLLFVIGGGLLLQTNTAREQSPMALSLENEATVIVAALPSPTSIPLDTIGGVDEGADFTSPASSATELDRSEGNIDEASDNEGDVGDDMAGAFFGGGNRDDVVAAGDADSDVTDSAAVRSAATEFEQDMQGAAESALNESESAQTTGGQAPAAAAFSLDDEDASQPAVGAAADQFRGADDSTVPAQAGAIAEAANAPAPPASTDGSVAIAPLAAQEESTAKTELAPISAIIAATSEADFAQQSIAAATERPVDAITSTATDAPIIEQQNAQQPAAEVAMGEVGEQLETPDERRNRASSDDNQDTLAIAALIAGLVLLSIAAATTITRRRGRA